jgi:ABC-2 type transport system ATP-binding protein
MPPTEPAIQAIGLRKTYGQVVAVEDVSFEVAQGEIFGLLGPNGAGKTTAVECVQGLRSPDAGQVRVLGLDPETQATELRRSTSRIARPRLQRRLSAASSISHIPDIRWQEPPLACGPVILGCRLRVSIQ